MRREGGQYIGCLLSLMSLNGEIKINEKGNTV